MILCILIQSTSFCTLCLFLCYCNILTVTFCLHYQVIFEAKVGFYNYGDIALDDIILEDGPCQTPSKSVKKDEVSYNEQDFVLVIFVLLLYLTRGIV